MDSKLKEAIEAKLVFRIGRFHANQALLNDIEELIDAKPEWPEELKDPKHLPADVAEAARAVYGTDDVEFDGDVEEDPRNFSSSDEGCWVRGWMWIAWGEEA